ncbi:MAG: hypothetical protein ACK41S_14520 [Planctomycetota bacterium]
MNTETVAPKVIVKKTIPQKQKTTIKLVMWALSHVMEREAMLVKIDEIFKLKDTSIESIIEMVDAVEKSMEYLVMDTELGALRQKEKPRKEKVAGDPDTIIKQLVDMAKDEVKPAKKTKKATADAAVSEGLETVVKEKKPRAKKAAADTDTVKTKKPRAKKTDVDYSPERPSPAFLPSPVENVDTDVEADESVDAKAPETVKKTPKPRAKKAAAVVAEEGAPTATEEDKKKPKPRTKKAVTDAAEGAAVVAEGAVVEEDKKKPKPRAKKVAAVVSEDGSVVEEDKKPKPKPKAKAKEEVPVVVHEVEESLEEDEYLLLNEVVVEGETYMVDSNQNIYDEFNKIIGKYDNGVVVLSA